jgi:hypothetical protein
VNEPGGRRGFFHGAGINNKPEVRSMQHDPKQEDMPIGLRMELSANLKALDAFAGLPPERQQAFIDGARAVRSKQDMQLYVDGLTNG